MKRILSVFLAIVMLFSVMAVTVSAADFRDTNAHWAAEFIDYWTAEKAVSGYPDATFRPENSVTRGEVAQVFAKVLNLAATSKSSPFTDMTAAAWYYTAVLACYDNGIIYGYPDKTVRADAPITREQVILMISRITDVATNASAAAHFVDNQQASSWAVGAIGALYSAGVLDGYKTAAGMEVRPQKNVSRAEFLKLLATVDKADNIKYTVGDRKAADNEPDEP
ncbi:MAG: S-layer homology domain-containing protein, partial [Oscillospiraceae bacterium]|nr:S-layer homology domain-containing protein [Oscillospiraceae bacterium]